MRDGSFRLNEDETRRTNHGNGVMSEAIDSRLPFMQKESALSSDVLDAIQVTKEAMRSRGTNDVSAQQKDRAVSATATMYTGSTIDTNNPGMEIPNIGQDQRKHYKSPKEVPNDYDELMDGVMNRIKTPVLTTRSVLFQPSMQNEYNNVKQNNRDEKSELRYQLDSDLNRITENFEKEFNKLHKDKDIIPKEVFDSRNQPFFQLLASQNSLKKHGKRSTTFT
jgi:hypothetical protein